MLVKNPITGTTAKLNESRSNLLPHLRMSLMCVGGEFKSAGGVCKKMMFHTAGFRKYLRLSGLDSGNPSSATVCSRSNCDGKAFMNIPGTRGPSSADGVKAGEMSTQRIHASEAKATSIGGWLKIGTQRM
jgi:hypothetical protein